MLHMVIVRHTAESCPGRPGNEAIHPCLQSLSELLVQREVKTVGRWADPPAHVNYLVLDAPNAHVIQEALMESGLSSHTTTEIRAVLSMD
ncbi:MAG TPA: hypothetical protein VHG91_17105 [Longimicrobium sp.]|nr:hypothetical protein [Longimicrobium sp.]